MHVRVYVFVYKLVIFWFDVWFDMSAAPLGA
jgi:hypothetical protein